MGGWFSWVIVESNPGAIFRLRKIRMRERVDEGASVEGPIIKFMLTTEGGNEGSVSVTK
jgi:hypothetical protein